ncbi:DNA repair protein RecO [Patescibacteria group bacterium]|nr:DNA repair protein RecO [Patescibacteria group bacterium]
MSPYLSTLALVINKKKTKEADLFVTLLTPHHGKIMALAKGAQNIKSSRLSALQLGNTIKTQLYQKNDFTWISQAQTQNAFLQNPKNLAQLNLLFYFLETINNLVVENQHTDFVYPLSQKIISAIQNNQVKNYLQNEIELIKTFGFGLPLEIVDNFQKGDYPKTQKQIQQFLQSIIEKPLQSPGLFS